MIILYGRPGAASLAPHICLHELGVSHEFVLVDADRAGPPGFLAASPHRRVPAFHDGGLTLTESAAIVMHLADRFPDGALGPPCGSTERSDWYRWLVYLTNTTAPDLYQWIYPERYTDAPGGAPGVRAAATDRLGSAFDWLDAELGERKFLVGARFGGADAFLWMLCRWSRHIERPAFSRPNLGRYWAAIAERPSVRRALDVEGITPLITP
jgi:glutathione S-transferase